MQQFATCHCHPQSLDSASTPEAFVKRELELGSGVITCTDHGTLQASQKIYELGKANGLIPIVGLEGYFRDDDCPILKKMGVPKSDTVARGANKDEWKQRYPDGTFIEYSKYFHITLHFMDEAAYKCGVRLLSAADSRAETHGQEQKPLFSWAEIEELAAHNVTATSSCLVGMVQRHLLNHQNADGAKAYYQRLHHLFGDRFYTEIFPHVCSHNWDDAVYIDVERPDGAKDRIRYYHGKKLKTNVGEVRAQDLAQVWGTKRSKHKELTEVKNYRTWEPFENGPLKILAVESVSDYIQNECKPWAPNGDVQYGCNGFVMQLSKKYNVPILIGDDSHFAHPEEKVVQDVRLAQGGGSWRFYGSYHRQSSEEAFGYFAHNFGVSEAQFEKWAHGTQEWAQRFKNFSLNPRPCLPNKFYPRDTLAHTKELIKYHGRMVNKPEYIQRLKDEIELLHRNGEIDLLPYFFLDEEVCRVYANEGLVTGPGRGSAAGLLLTYLLGITHVDPLRYGLSMERFLTVDRIKSGKLPDIDQDLPTRDLLVGGFETDVIEFEAEDGTAHTAPASLVVKTDAGYKTLREVAAEGLDFQPWWQPGDRDGEINENR